MPEAVQGLDDLFAKLGALESLVMQKKLLARAGRAAGEPIKEAGARRAPNDPDTPGSRISENMMISVREQTATSALVKIGPGTKRGAGRVGSFAERGTAHQPRRPWLGPAFDESREEALRIFAETLTDEIEAAVR